jgi:hypothetical protein
VAYETCADVSQEIWRDLRKLDPGEVRRRTGAAFEDGCYRLLFLHRPLAVDLGRARVVLEDAPGEDPGFRVCLTALLYLQHLDPAALGPGISPLDLAGGVTFFRGHHGLPSAPLEGRFGRDLPAFLAAGSRLGAKTAAAGDAALVFQVFPGLEVGVILWQADEEFPAQVSFTLPAHLDRFWHLDAVWGLLSLVAQELLRAADPELQTLTRAPQ